MNSPFPALTLSSSEPARHVRVHSPAAIAALTDALAAEERLLAELTGVLRTQRDAVARDDLDALDDAVFATHRVLLTLGEARKRRRGVTRMLGDGDDLSLAALDAVFGGVPPVVVREAAARVADAARVLHREVDVNRQVLRAAIDSGDQLVRALVGAPDEAAGYEPRTAQQAGGVMLDRRI